MASIVASELLPGEEVEISTLAELGSFRPVVGKSAAGIATGVAIGAPAGMAVLSLVRRRRYGVMLTNRRLLLIDASQGIGRFLGVAGSLPREQIERSAVGKRVYLSYDLLERGTGRGLCKLSFPLPARRHGLQIAAAFPEVARLNK